MISKNAHEYCSESISKIANYNLAIQDTDRTWHIHHLLECGENPIPREVLIQSGRYYSRPASELCFVPASVHWNIHLASRRGRKFVRQSWMPELKIGG